MEMTSKFYLSVSHAAAYAAISMQTAYLKCHYPSEFFAGLLTSEVDDTVKLALYANECKKNRVKIEPPDINLSQSVFSVEKNGSICYGLSSIVGIGAEAVEKIIEERNTNGKFVDLYDFMQRCPKVGRGALENLIKAGAFDYTGYNRPSLIEATSIFRDSIKKDKANNISDQISLFDFVEDDTSTAPIIRVLKDVDPVKKVMDEKEATGMFISYHPLDAITIENPEKFKYINIEKTKRLHEKIGNREFSIKGIVSSVKITYTKAKNDKMAIIRLEDSLDSISVVVFPKLYKRVGEKLEENKIVTVTGTIGDKGDDISIIAEDVIFH